MKFIFPIPLLIYVIHKIYSFINHKKRVKKFIESGDYSQLETRDILRSKKLKSFFKDEKEKEKFFESKSLEIESKIQCWKREEKLNSIGIK